ncbi:hypothetical protein GCM10010211_42430 [Streptomyces albospinus]|uniref:Uncharacterized protein n=1 Tax=Streptomyces albospinus TaxID=285515 RepID=A0ABQ2V8A1_9ACTN|nr:rodlin [Streptomyces albospinus]GGU72076.1 hypothetical protein GCM10010211_42430 [Streptomyces albospinus]
MKEMTGAGAIATSSVGVSAAAAPHALAIGDQDGSRTVDGNGSKSVYGNSTTHGERRTQPGILQGGLNCFCVGIPAKGSVQSLVGVTGIGVQDIDVLSSSQVQPQMRQCARNLTQATGDEAPA